MATIDKQKNRDFQLNRCPLVAKIDGTEFVKLSRDMQKLLGCVINEDVSLEYPYAFVSRQKLSDISREVNSPLDHLVEKIGSYAVEEVLVGYACNTVEVDKSVLGAGNFIICLTEETTSAFISYNRSITKNFLKIAKNQIRKKAKQWKDHGTTEEVKETFLRMTRPLYEIDVCLPISKLCCQKHLSDRGPDGVRDGYVELVSSKKFKNIALLTKTETCQTNLESKDVEIQTYHEDLTNKWTAYDFEIPVDFQNIWNHVETDEEEMSNEENDETNSTENKVERVITDEELHIKENRRKQWGKVNNFLKIHIDDIIEAVTFNATVNLYKNDVANLAVNETNSLLMNSRKEYNERVTLVDLRTIKDRHLFSFSWHSTLSNVIICTYSDKDCESCSLITLWSLHSPLWPKIILNCEENISEISFCPLKSYSNIVIGGSFDGKIIVWEIDEHWLIDEQNNEDDILSNDKYIDSVNKEAKIAASAEKAQKLSITSIQWLPSWCGIKADGNFEKICCNSFKLPKPYFATASIDGSILFWSLPRLLSISSKTRSPLHLTIAPIYQLLFEEPDEKVMSRIQITCFNLTLAKSEESLNLDIRNKFNLEKLRKVFVGTVMGEVICCTWEGQIYNADVTDYETCKILTRSCVHDGIVRTMTKSFHLDDVFLTVGGRVFAIWKEDFPYAPIFQKRTKKCRYGEGCWSGRSGMFILTRLDGCFELWDLKEKCNEPVMLQTISGKNAPCTVHAKITPYIIPSPPNAREKLVAILDGPSVLRIFAESGKDSEDENLERIEWLEEFVWRETKRKYDFRHWQNNYLQQHPTALARKSEREEVKAKRKHEEARQRFLMVRPRMPSFCMCDLA
ncbi:PREDICTED: WD repeat-containing protein 63-like [Ceratosolen solmsi marchali]|uniref:WD repeat-containing protein 63-like n=1 Tax=Ceratosolen solmsi marchali TaxID=326594 RepID=A0AAJ7DV90_9HYME|nr:PREDICTED: WD repeat-containing protein 63-like [Ceratosolen solmsi marchali]